MTNCSKRIILGSGSPRRRELLGGLDIEFTVDTGNSFVETYDPATTRPEDVPVLMALGKSHGFHRNLEQDEILITADTVVLVGDPASRREVLGKPKDKVDAVRMLKELSASTHEVITAVTIRTADKEKSFTDSTLVTFGVLSDEEIDYYLEKYKPYDKAGAYGVQEWIGYVAIESLQGSFYNVMGFPTHKVWDELQNWL